MKKNESMDVIPPIEFEKALLKPFKGVGQKKFFFSLSLFSLFSPISTIQNLLKF